MKYMYLFRYKDIEYIVCGVKKSYSVFRLSNIRKHHDSPGVQVQNRPGCSPHIWKQTTPKSHKTFHFKHKIRQAFDMGVLCSNLTFLLCSNTPIHVFWPAFGHNLIKSAVWNVLQLGYTNEISWSSKLTQVVHLNWRAGCVLYYFYTISVEEAPYYWHFKRRGTISFAILER